jgi:hypothetical protein
VWIFFIFQPSKIHVGPTNVVSSISPSRCHLSSNRRHHATASCHTSFPRSQDELTVSASSFGNALSRHLPYRVKTEALNPHHRRRPPFLNCPTPTLLCYKNVISTLDTLSTTQLSLFCLLPSQSTTSSKLHP